jgi:hypothetical protein
VVRGVDGAGGWLLPFAAAGEFMEVSLRRSNSLAVWSFPVQQRTGRMVNEIGTGSAKDAEVLVLTASQTAYM